MESHFVGVEEARERGKKSRRRANPTCCIVRKWKTLSVGVGLPPVFWKTSLERTGSL